MAFPQTPLPLLASIAPGADLTAAPETWDPLWTSITADVRLADGVVVEAGRSDEAGQVDTSTCTMRMDNRSGNYSPRNPMGTWYGKIGKGTPLKVEVQRGNDTFNRTAATTWGASDLGNTWGTTDNTNFAISISPATGGVMGLAAANSVNANQLSAAGSWNADVLMEFSLPVVPAGAAWISSAQMRRNGPTTFMGVSVAVQAGGQVDLTIDRFYGTAARFILATQTAALATYTAGRKIWIRARTLGVVTYAKCWYDGSAEPSTFNLIFTETNPDLMYDAENSIGVLGANVGVHAWRVTGNTNTTQMNIWAFSSVSPVYYGQVVEWPVRWDQSAADASVPLTAAGIIRRLSQGQSVLGSPLTKTLGSQSSVYGFWPLEDTSGSATAAGIGAGIKPATVYQASFGYSGTDLGGSSSTMTITQNTTISGLLPRVTLSPTSGWTCIFYILMEALPPSGQDATVMQIKTSGARALYSVIVQNSGQVGFQTVDTDGTVGAFVGLGVGSFAAAAWYEIRLEAYQPTNLAVRLTSIAVVAGTTFQNTFTSGTGALGIPNQWSIYGSSTSFPAGSVGEVAFFRNGGVFSTTATLAAARGYAGETASARIQRLCAERGVPLTLLGTSTTLMGAQTSDTFLDLLRQCETADLGILYETNYTPGLGYRPRTARYSTASRTTLSFSTGAIAAPPEPTDDDQQLRNDWTVTRTGGSSAQVTDSASIASQGRYDDSIEINVSSDDVLLNHAGLRVYLGTLNALRWPKIDFDLARNLGITTQWQSFLVGSRFTVLNPPAAQLPGEVVDVVIEGWTQTLSAYSWDVTMNCSPAIAWSQFRPAGDSANPLSTDPRIDSASSYLDAAINATATSLVIDHATGDGYWDPAAVPFDIKITGERITVTAISGTGLSQTCTVTRSVNSIAKSHLANETISLWAPAYLAL